MPTELGKRYTDLRERFDNAVKELVLCGLFLSSRKIVQGVNWTTCLKEKGDETEKLVEKNKSAFKGTEIKGKTLGIIGLGAIGMQVANDAAALGMKVVGYDPYISVDNAWKLSSLVRKARDIKTLLENSDYISLHVPLMEKTKGMFNREIIAHVKKGVKVLNFSRDGLVDTDALLEALDSGAVSRYVTDFPNCKFVGNEKVLLIPHLGASTKEAEENCAVMVTDQIMDYLSEGNIRNSVNFPECVLPKNGHERIVIVNKNIPGMIEKITTVLAGSGLNIAEMLNKSKGEYAYNILDLDGDVVGDVVLKLAEIDGILKVRKV